MALFPPKRIRLKDGIDAVIRSAREDDAQALLEGMQSVFRDGEGMVADPDEFTKTEDEERSWVSAFNENPQALVLVVEVRGRLIGLIDFNTAKRRRLAHSGEFGMSVQPGWRGRGVGNALLEALVAWARSVPEIEKITLKVRADNERAIALYRKHGFVQSGCARDAIKLREGVYVDDIAMERFVRC